MTERTIDPDILKTDELKRIADELTEPAVILEWRSILFPGNLRLPTWVASVLVDGRVEGQIADDCPLLAYSVAMIVLCQNQGIDFDWPAIDASVEAWKAQVLA